MAYFHINHMSKELKMLTNVVAVLPEFDHSAGIPEPFPVLYLLHGFGHDCFGWLHNSSAARYASERGLALVLPSGYNSAYTDMRYGQAYFTYIFQELPAYLRTVLPITRDPRRTYICGNSMGGYGALKCALTGPERYGAAVSLSGSLHAEDRILGRSANSGNQCTGIYGDPPQIDPESQDLFIMLRRCVERGSRLPRIALFCAKDDKAYLYRSSAEFKELADALQVPVSFEDGYGGHTFTYWDALLPRVMDWCLQGEEVPA